MEDGIVITAIKNVIFVAPDRYPEEKTAFRRNLTSHELIFHFSGTATVYFGDQILETAPGVIRYLPKGDVSRYEVERREPGSCIDVFFQTDRPLSHEAFTLNASEDSRLGSLFQKLFTLWVAKGEGSHYECTSLLYRIFAQMQRCDPAPRQKHSRIDPAVDYIRENFLSPDLQVERLGQRCGISYSYLKKLFVSRFGMAPKQYVIHLKMNYACDLLRTRRYSVARVAELCGFRDVYFFSRQFKAHRGVSPSAYAREYEA